MHGMTLVSWQAHFTHGFLCQVAEHRLPKAFDYHRTPAPFIQVSVPHNLPASML